MSTRAALGTIYILQNKINGKCYIGQTTGRASIRLSRHKNSKSLVGRAISKYGWECFRVYQYRIQEEMLDYFEMEMIKRLNSISPNGYNLMSGGQKHRHVTEATRQKIRLSLLGRHVSEETRKKLSEARRGIKLSQETCQKISESRRGERHHLFGKHHSEETRRKISEALAGEKHFQWGKARSEEVKKKISLSEKGRPSPTKGMIPSLETRKKISSGLRGRIASEATRQKLSESAKRIWQRKKLGAVA